MVEAPLTAPVTSLTIFGNSVGTVVLQIAKVAILATIILGVCGNSLMVLFESDFTIGGNTGNAVSLLIHYLERFPVLIQHGQVLLLNALWN